MGSVPIFPVVKMGSVPIFLALNIPIRDRSRRDILIDHAHGSGLAIVSARNKKPAVKAMQEQYRQALDRLLGAVR
jgi:hypothetical protein